MVEVRSAEPRDLEAMTAIYNDAVEKTTGTFDIRPRTTDEQREWYAGHGKRHPVVVAEFDGAILGWAALTSWSDRRAYERTAEVSVYVAEAARSRGVGTTLMGAILERGADAGLHAVIAQISTDNEASLGLHRAAGFEAAGTLRQVGEKFGRLLDVRLMQKIL